MGSPTVSVIIPTYNGIKFLVEAIRSVLNQTYPHFELIVVDDVSPDNTGEVVKQYTDPRVKYILHEKNQGAVAARQTGVQVSSGEIIAFLDQDDLFHPEKLQTHVNFLEQHPEIGATYNARFELEPESEAIRAIWQPPETVTLADLVLGFPFSPSDTVLRREWAVREDIWDQSFVLQGDEKIFNGGEIVFGGRLVLAGCKLTSVGRTLNYRRYHPRRVFSNLSSRCKAERTCQEIVLNDPRCPDEARTWRNSAFMNTYLIWAYYAFAQDETGVGQAFLREALSLNPTLLQGWPCELVNFFAFNSAIDSSFDLEELLQKIFNQLPAELAGLSTQLDWAVARGYLIRGTQAILWDRPEEGRLYFARVAGSGAELDELFIQKLTFQLLNHQKELGAKATQKVLQNLTPCLEKVSNRKNVRWLKACYSVNRAFQSYQAGEYAQVPGEVMRAVTNDPKYLFNRGVLSILLRSIAAPLPHLEAM
jgi:glycosyltransferase involved in cell wall biosynthesis